MDDVDKANDLAEALRDSRILGIQRDLARVNTNPNCIECDEEIEAERREKMPSARYCVSCQSELERRRKTHRQ